MDNSLKTDFQHIVEAVDQTVPFLAASTRRDLAIAVIQKILDITGSPYTTDELTRILAPAEKPTLQPKQLMVDAAVDAAGLA